MADQFPPLHLWLVAVDGYGTSEFIARSMGRALADAWRCDAFNAITFKEFLRIARARKGQMPPNYGDECTVEGKPARYFGTTRASVTVQMAGRDSLSFAHPYDVWPQGLRPLGYRSPSVT